MRSHNTKTGEIKSELRKAMELLGADRELLAALGSGRTRWMTRRS